MPHNLSLTLIGVGNAYDGAHTNASMLVEEQGYRLLIDCGPTVPAKLFSQLEVDSLDAVYLTHSHPDHCLGITSLLNWMASKGRSRPLTLVAQRAQWQVLEPLVNFAHWPEAELPFQLDWQASEQLQNLGPWPCKMAPTRHALSNLSIQLTSALGPRVFFSGDGLLSTQGEALAADSDIVFVECETLSHHPSHGSWQDIQHLPRKEQSRWWLYHIEPVHRQALASLCAGHSDIDVAEEGMHWQLSADDSKPSSRHWCAEMLRENTH
ncbi:MBL fold metallo-hydrolase [Aliagarivorans taiwanensis]|uniref:MBL fold metallo-hydrolase n=1 Tax=Aliagarivorans taiwanensis TaxID=561966 RepID=UPI000409D492|nr:MBL fold metallo-hydrolase [Aliagarivorans taiwanensis]